MFHLALAFLTRKKSFQNNTAFRSYQCFSYVAFIAVACAQSQMVGEAAAEEEEATVLSC